MPPLPPKRIGYDDGTVLYQGDCRAVLPFIPCSSVDAVICDPPYPCIKRAYGMLTEAEWWDLMMVVCRETRRVLKPTGSAVFILQPNSRKVGSMRGWLWRFLLWATEEWNVVQDAYWWNPATLPGMGCSRQGGLMRQSLKACVWLGPSECYRNQGAVLWEESFDNAYKRAQAKAANDNKLQNKPSGHHVRVLRCTEAAERRGGTTPFNVLPIGNTNNSNSAGMNGHGAGTPEKLCRWWSRYICPPGGTILDPFVGSGTTLLAARKEGRRGIGIEQMPEYVETCKRRLAETVG